MTATITEQPILYSYIASPGQTEFNLQCRIFDLYLDAFEVTVNGYPCAYASIPANNREFYTEQEPGGAEGGTLIFGAGLSNGDVVRILRTLPVERITNFPESGPVDMADVNLELTRIVALEQDGRQLAERELDSVEERAVRVPSGETVPALQAAVDRINRFMRWSSIDGASVTMVTLAQVAGELLPDILTLLGSAYKGDPGSPQEGYATRTAMALAGNDASSLDDAYLTEGLRHGKFVFYTAASYLLLTGQNLVDCVAADPLQGLYVAAESDPTGADGAWVRIFEGKALAIWWGAGPEIAADNNALAINGAIATLEDLNFLGTGGYGTGGGINLHIPAGDYDVSAEILISSSLVLTGDFSGQFAGGGTRLNFTVPCHGIRIEKLNGWARVEGLFLHGSADTPGSGFNGIHARGQVAARNMFIRGFDHGIDCAGDYATNFENTNGSSFENIGVTNCAWGTHTLGADANGIRFTNMVIVLNHLGGHLDRSFLGCLYDGGLIESCGGDFAGTYKVRCSYMGNVYMCLLGQETWCSSNAPTGTTASNQGWIYIGPGTPDISQQAWTAGQTWYFSAPYAMDPGNNNARSRFRDIYIEPNMNPAVITWPGRSDVAHDLERVITPIGEDYGAAFRVGANGEYQMGDITIGNLKAKSCWIRNPVTDTRPGFSMDTLGNIIVGHPQDPGVVTGNTTLKVNTYGGTIREISFEDGGAVKAAISSNGDELYFYNGSFVFRELDGAVLATIYDQGLLLSPNLSFDTSGTGGYKFNGQKVVGAREGAVPDAVAAAGATPTKAEFDALVSAFNLLLDRQRNHGLIAT